MNATVHRVSRLEFQQTLMQCAVCDRLSAHVTQAIRPSSAGRRTDATWFGLCDEHVTLAMGIAMERGYVEGITVPWEALGEIVEHLPAFGVELVE